MDQNQYKLWVTQVPSLSKEQISDLLTRLKLVSKIAVKTHTGKQDFGDRVVQALCSMMNNRGIECPNAATLKKSSAYVQSQDKMQDLAAFFVVISTKKVEQDAILKLAIELLYFDLLAWQGIAISSHTMLKQIHRLPSTLNRHFPGYAQSGLLLKLVNR